MYCKIRKRMFIKAWEISGKLRHWKVSLFYVWQKAYMHYLQYSFKLNLKQQQGFWEEQQCQRGLQRRGSVFSSILCMRIWTFPWLRTVKVQREECTSEVTEGLIWTQHRHCSQLLHSCPTKRVLRNEWMLNLSFSFIVILLHSIQ